MEKVAILFCLIIVSGSCQMIRYMDEDDIGDPCVWKKGQEGILAIRRVCQQQQKQFERLVGFIEDIKEFLVCCAEVAVGDRAQKYCDENGKEAPMFLETNIIGGNDSKPLEFPHAVALGYRIKGEIVFDCGGSLISEKFVITAAHCFKRDEPVELVRIGRTSLDLTNTTDTGIVHDSRAKTITLHPKYGSSRKYNDIALIELESPVTFSRSIRPICLTTAKDDVGESRNLTIIGFGIIDRDTQERSSWLQKAAIAEVSPSGCNERYRKIIEAKVLPSMREGVLESQICAVDGSSSSNDDKRVDACQGDSGSALQITSSVDHKYYIVGVTSFGLACGSSFPSVYTRISHYMDWIEGIVWP